MYAIHTKVSISLRKRFDILSYSFDLVFYRILKILLDQTIQRPIFLLLVLNLLQMIHKTEEFHILNFMIESVN